MKTRLFLLTLILTIFCCSCNRHVAERTEMDIFIDTLMSKMTLEEKIGQMNLPVAGTIITGSAQSSDIAGAIRNGRVGGLFNVKGCAEIYDLQRIAVEESRLGIPLLFGMDVIHGYETIFPLPLAVACSWDTLAAYNMARVAAQEASSDGINWTFSPMADVSCDARWGRVSEGFGEDPYLVSAMVSAMVRGYEGDNLGDSATILSCLKHFALYGAVEGGLEYNNTEMSRYRMYNDYFPPYKAAVDAGVSSVMASFNTVEGIPATCNRWLLTEVLRDDWGFKGFVVSDYTALQELRDHGAATDKHEAARMSLSAGLDMDMVSEGFWTLENDEDMLALIDQACRRVLEAKYKLGLFDNPYKYCNVHRAADVLLSDANRQLARQTARETFVLLKNDDHLLPLSKDMKVALIGPLADTRANMSGTWAVAARAEEYKTLREGLDTVLTANGGQLFYAKGCNLVYDAQLEARATMFGREMRDERTSGEMLAEAIEIAQRADVIVAAMGESSEYSGECASRTELTMPDAQHDLLVELNKLGKPIVLLNFSGRPVVLNWEDENLSAIMQVWFGGSETADAIADVLFGDYSPSGKLAMAFPRAVGQMPMTYRYYNTSRPLAEGSDTFSKYQSSYIDCRRTPLYCFGYGLTYTDFEYSNLQISDTLLDVNDKDYFVALSFEVTNKGDYDAFEIVQLYIRDMVSLPVRPVKELRSWQRLFIPKGETHQVTFHLTRDMLGFYDAQGHFLTPEGEYEIMVGTNSVDVQKIRIHLTQF